jgi:hypothetical protein
VVLVTHEAELASRAQRLIRLADGVVVEDRVAAGLVPEGLVPEGLVPEGLVPEGLVPEGTA